MLETQNLNEQILQTIDLLNKYKKIEISKLASHLNLTPKEAIDFIQKSILKDLLTIDEKICYFTYKSQAIDDFSFKILNDNCDVENLLIVGSTHNLIKETYNEKHLPFAYIAETQLLGVGRKDRPWQSPVCENIYFSMAIKLPTTAINALSLSLSVALVDTFKSFDVKALIKYPNDIYVNNKKIAGILIDSIVKQDESVVIISSGININMKQNESINQPWTSMFLTLNKNTSRGSFLKVMVDNFAKILELHVNKGFKAIREQYMQHFLLTGKKCILPDKNLEGLVQFIDSNGVLNITTNGALYEVLPSDNIRFLL